jgi:hypothetical protein
MNDAVQTRDFRFASAAMLLPRPDDADSKQTLGDTFHTCCISAVVDWSQGSQVPDCRAKGRAQHWKEVAEREEVAPSSAVQGECDHRADFHSDTLTLTATYKTMSQRLLSVLTHTRRVHEPEGG